MIIHRLSYLAFGGDFLDLSLVRLANDTIAATQGIFKNTFDGPLATGWGYPLALIYDARLSVVHATLLSTKFRLSCRDILVIDEGPPTWPSTQTCLPTQVATPRDNMTRLATKISEKTDAQGQIFTYRGHTFCVRARLSEKGWTVQVYENEKPISPPYKVTHETAIDFSTAGWGHAVEALMHTAQSDVEEEHLPEVKKLFKST